MGRIDEALAEARRARELDPLSLTIVGGYGRVLHDAGRMEDAAAHLRGVVAMDSTFILTNEWLGITYLGQGRLAEALPLLERSVEPGVRQSITLAQLGYGLAKLGRRKEAELLLGELMDRRAKGYVTPTSIAFLHAGLGDTAETFTWLRRAAESHDPFLIYNFVNEPLLNPLKRDPRGAAILREMGLAPARQ